MTSSQPLKKVGLSRLIVRNKYRELYLETLPTESELNNLIEKVETRNRTVMKLQTTCKQLDATDFMKIMLLDVVILLIQFMLLIIIWG